MFARPYVSLALQFEVFFVTLGEWISHSCIAPPQVAFEVELCGFSTTVELVPTFIKKMDYRARVLFEARGRTVRKALIDARGLEKRIRRFFEMAFTDSSVRLVGIVLTLN